MAKNNFNAMYEKETAFNRFLKAVKGVANKTVQAIKNAFYDFQVIMSRLLHPNGIRKKSTIRGRKVGEIIFISFCLIYPLVHFAIFYIGVNINSILLSFKAYSEVEVDGVVFRDYIWANKAAETNYDLFYNIKKFLASIGVLDAEKFNVVPEANYDILLKNSFLSWASTTFIGLPLNLIFAFIIYKKVPAAGFFQVVLYLPQILSSMVVSLMFLRFMESGVWPAINGGIPEEGLLTNQKSGMFWQLFYCIWAGFGGQLILYSGAMSRVPDSLIEFGELEGITMIKEFWYVTIPMIFSTITVFIVTGVAGFFTSQMALFNFYGSGAPGHLQTIGYKFYIMTVGSSTSPKNFPYASAGGILFTLVVAPVTLVARHLLEKYGPQAEF